MNWQQQDNNKQTKSMNQMVGNQSTKTGQGNQSRNRQQPSPSSEAFKNAHLFPLHSPPKNNSFPPTHSNFSDDNQSYSPNSVPPQQKLKPVSGQSSRRDHTNHSHPPTAKNRRPKRRKKQKSPPPPNHLSVFFLFIVRLLVVIIGVSSIWGTTLSIVNSTNSSTNDDNITTIETAQASTNEAEQPLENILFSTTSLGNKLSSLETKITNLATQYNQLQPGVFLVDLDNNGYVTIKGETPFSSASTIKVPVLVALFQAVDQGKVQLDEKLVMSEDVIAGGSGNMQYEEPGKQFSVLETATKMIVISDNTATNMLIKRLGGAETLNQRFLEWGLAATIINNPLPDLEGTNTTSPADLGNLLIAIEKGNLISLRSRDRLLQIMRDTRTDTLLPEGLEEDATIAHKTGDIRSVLGDVGIIDMPNGKRYIASVLVKRPSNDPQAKKLIQQISRTTYEHFKWTSPQPN